LTGLGYETFSAKYEAEALCAHMTSTGRAAYCLTEDSDALAFGAPLVVFKYGSPEACTVKLSDCLESLQLSRNQFIDLCCMFGCDFCPNVHKIGPVGAFKLLQDHGSWSSAFASKNDMWPQLTQESAVQFDKAYKEVFQCFATQGYENSTVEE